MRSLEVIIVDNGSIDETPQIVAAYARRDSRVVPSHEPIPGAAAARNAGLVRARGEWIASMDADDVARPGRLEHQLALGKTSSRLSLIGSGFDEIVGDGALVRSYAYPQKDGALRRRLQRLKGFFPASSAFFPRAVAQRIGGYRPAIGYAEDWDMWLRLAAVGQLACLPQSLVAIRRHESQVSQFHGGRPQAIHAVAATVAHFLRTGGSADPIAVGDEPRQRFLGWVERRMVEDGYFEQRRVWQGARARALSGGNRVAAAGRFGLDLMRSGYGPALVGQKLAGNSLPRRLAAEWARGLR
jgi:hypothetical protein